MPQKYFFTTILSAIIFLFPEHINSQEPASADKDKQLFEQYIEKMAPSSTEPIETILSQTATFFLQTPYVDHTLDINKQEALVTNLHEFDCVTFVENVMALSFAVRDGELSFDYFKKKLTELRYRNSEITDYASRLHYTSDWIFENEKDGFIKNISRDLSGRKEAKQINFMSAHRSAYKQLVNNDVLLTKIAQIEQNMNNRGGFFYLPKEMIDEKANDISHMSIVAFVTAIDGLDVTHVGFAYWRDNGELTFIHASSAKGQVVIEPRSLRDYCMAQKNCKGVIVAKVL